MTETKALAIRTVTPDLWHTIDLIAPTMHQSRFFGVTSKEQAAAIMLKGWELGLPLSASFEFIHVIQGKPTLSPRGALALVLSSNLLEDMQIDEQQDRCTVYMKRRGGPSYRLTWTLDDAKRAGVVKPDSAWQSYTANMLRWRCIGFVLDVLFSDVCGGLKRADEFGAVVDVNGDVVGEWTEMPPTTTTTNTPPTPTTPTVTLDQLVNEYGAEAVIVANQGKIPATDDEVAEVARRLANG